MRSLHKLELPLSVVSSSSVAEPEFICQDDKPFSKSPFTTIDEHESNVGFDVGEVLGEAVKS